MYIEMQVLPIVIAINFAQELLLCISAAGVLVKSIEFATNRVPRIMGKPSLNMFYMLQAYFSLQPEKTLIIGDT